MKNPALLLVLLFTGIWACKKSDNPDNTSIDPSNAPALSAAINVWHGARLSGTPPAPTQTPGGPELDPFTSNQPIRTIAGRYAIIQPQVTGGAIAGYYISVTGAQEYFKIDYSRPRVGRQGDFGRRSRALRLFGMDSTGNNADSSIVITIPSNIQPGQFCISYCAYDSAGNISNIISTCITVASFGGDASSSYLVGTWSNDGFSSDTAMGWEDVLRTDTSYIGLNCDSNRLSMSCPTFNCTYQNYPWLITSTDKSDFTFTTNGGLKLENNYWEKNLDLATSTCSNLVFNTTWQQDDEILGAWSYNAATNKLVMILDFDAQGNPAGETYEFSVHKQSNTLVYLYSAYDDFWVRFKK